MSLFYTNKDIPYQFQDEIKATEVETGLTQRAKTCRAATLLKRSDTSAGHRRCSLSTRQVLGIVFSHSSSN